MNFLGQVPINPIWMVIEAWAKLQGSLKRGEGYYVESLEPCSIMALQWIGSNSSGFFG